MHKSDPSNPAEKKKTSVVATLGFIALSLLFVFAAAQMIGGVLHREFSGNETALEATPAPTAEALPTDTPSQGAADAVVAIRTPAPEAALASITPEPAQSTPSPTPAQDAAAAAASTAPAATPAQPQMRAASFEDGRMDLVIAMVNDSGFVDCLCVLALRENRATLLAVPANTLGADGKPLSSCSRAQLLGAARGLLAVQYEKYAVIERASLQRCADAIGPLTIGGKEYDGAALLDYLQGSGGDALLRAERFAAMLEGLANRLDSLSLLRMLTAKNALQAAVKANIREAEGWRLYHAVRNLTEAEISRRTLPVNSLQSHGRRCYAPDEALTEKLLDELYNS